MAFHEDNHRTGDASHSQKRGTGRLMGFFVAAIAAIGGLVMRALFRAEERLATTTVGDAVLALARGAAEIGVDVALEMSLGEDDSPPIVMPRSSVDIEQRRIAARVKAALYTAVHAAQIPEWQLPYISSLAGRFSCPDSIGSASASIESRDKVIEVLRALHESLEEHPESRDIAAVAFTASTDFGIEDAKALQIIVAHAEAASAGALTGRATLDYLSRRVAGEDFARALEVALPTVDKSMRDWWVAKIRRAKQTSESRSSRIATSNRDGSRQDTSR